MQTVNPYVKQYRKNQIETATPEQILILLYDGAIQYLNKAKIAIEQKNGEDCNKNIYGCQKIILEFMNTLDMENGGEVAVNLHNLYQYFYNTLLTANIGRDIKKIDEILKHLKNLRETWSQAISIANAEKTFHSQEDTHIDIHESSDEDEEYDDEEDEDDE